MALTNSRTTPISILIADDLEIVIEGLEALLQSSTMLEVVGSANTGTSAVQKALEIKPDVILMDISMPEMDGLEATRKIKSLLPDTKVLILTMYDMPDMVNEALMAKVDGFLLKNTSKAELKEAIEKIVDGELYLSSKIKEDLAVHRMQYPDGESKKPLSKREKEIVKLILKEMTTQEMAESLFLSPATVETHRRNIMVKLRVRNTAGLVKYAVERGWSHS